jgi:hypothetical protein
MTKETLYPAHDCARLPPHIPLIGGASIAENIGGIWVNRVRCLSRTDAVSYRKGIFCDHFAGIRRENRSAINPAASGRAKTLIIPAVS